MGAEGDRHPCSSVDADPDACPSPCPAHQAISALPSSRRSGQLSMAALLRHGMTPSPTRNCFPAKAARAGEGLSRSEPGGERQTHLPVAAGMLEDKALHPPLALLEELGAAVVPQGELLDHQVLRCAHLLAQVQPGHWGGRGRAQLQLRLLQRWGPPCPSARTACPLTGVPVMRLSHVPTPGAAPGTGASLVGGIVRELSQLQRLRQPLLLPSGPLQPLTHNCHPLGL